MPEKSSVGTQTGQNIGSSHDIDETKSFSATGGRILLGKTNRTDQPKSYALNISVIRSQNINCSALFRTYDDELSKAIDYQKSTVELIGNGNLVSMTGNCTAFALQRKYIMFPVNHEEAEFPLAFSILLYKEADMAERLLRAIYRPQNVYCLHIDDKAEQAVKDEMAAVAKCFNNVFIASHAVKVEWGKYSELEADLKCMEDLWKYPNWKYFINLTGQEFPLLTNWDMVRILKMLKGANNILSER